MAQKESSVESRSRSRPAREPAFLRQVRNLLAMIVENLRIQVEKPSLPGEPQQEKGQEEQEEDRIVKRKDSPYIHLF